MSLPCATGTMAPTRPPPRTRRSSRRWNGPGPTGCGSVRTRRLSVVTDEASSGVFVFPAIHEPRGPEPLHQPGVRGAPPTLRPSGPASRSGTGRRAECATASLRRNGTPRNGPSGSGPAASARARCDRSMITALSVGFSASIRARAASRSSLGVTVPAPYQLRLGCRVEPRRVVRSRLALRAGGRSRHQGWGAARRAGPPRRPSQARRATAGAGRLGRRADVG